MAQRRSVELLYIPPEEMAAVRNLHDPSFVLEGGGDVMFVAVHRRVEACVHNGATNATFQIGPFRPFNALRVSTGLTVSLLRDIVPLDDEPKPGIDFVVVRGTDAVRAALAHEPITRFNGDAAHRSPGV